MCSVACTKNTAEVEKRNQQSYALGIQAGSAFKAQGFVLDADEYARGFEDGLNGTGDISDLEAQKIVVAAQLEKQQQENIHLLDREAEGKQYLEKNALRPEVKSIQQGLQYEVLSQGKGATPKQTDRVAIYLKGSLPDGTVFEDTFATKKAKQVSVIELSAGLRMGIQNMKVGSRYRFFLAPEFAFGLRGTKEVPPQSVVLYDVELAQIVTKK